MSEKAGQGAIGESIRRGLSDLQEMTKAFPDSMGQQPGAGSITQPTPGAIDRANMAEAQEAEQAAPEPAAPMKEQEPYVPEM